MKNNISLPPFPSGWFAIASSKELKKRKSLNRTFMGQKIILFHTPNGPCIKPTAYRIDERDGFIFLYHGNPEKMHKLPHLAKDGWRPYRMFSIKLKSHPQETSENFVDICHLSAVHHVPNASMDTNSFNSEILSFNYTSKTSVKVSSHVFGLGYSFTEIQLPLLKTKIGLLSSACPIDETFLVSRTLFFLKIAAPPSFFQKLFLPILSYVMFKTLCRFITQDAVIWNHKKYLARPILTPNDGPILLFRKWARRFYE